MTKKGVCVKAFQMLSSYRCSGSYVIRESYPLPPYSTVIGMVHNVCGFESYVPMDISVQGISNSSVSEMYTHYSFTPAVAFDKGRHQLAVKHDDKVYGVNRGPLHIQLNCEVELLLHIIPHDEKMTEAIENGLKNPKIYPSLGRYEDILRIDEVKTVEISDRCIEDTETLKYDAYVEKNYAEEIGINFGTVYRLNKDYDDTDKKDRRRWMNRIETRFVPKGKIIYEPEDEESKVYFDSDGNLVFFA